MWCLSPYSYTYTVNCEFASIDFVERFLYTQDIDYWSCFVFVFALVVIDFCGFSIFCCCFFEFLPFFGWFFYSVFQLKYHHSHTSKKFSNATLFFVVGVWLYFFFLVKIYICTICFLHMQTNFGWSLLLYTRIGSGTWKDVHQSTTKKIIDKSISVFSCTRVCCKRLTNSGCLNGIKSKLFSAIWLGLSLLDFISVFRYFRLLGSVVILMLVCSLSWRTYTITLYVFRFVSFRFPVFFVLEIFILVLILFRFESYVFLRFVRFFFWKQKIFFLQWIFRVKYKSQTGVKQRVIPKKTLSIFSLVISKSITLYWAYVNFFLSLKSHTSIKMIDKEWKTCYILCFPATGADWIFFFLFFHTLFFFFLVDFVRSCCLNFYCIAFLLAKPNEIQKKIFSLYKLWKPIWPRSLFSTRYMCCCYVCCCDCETIQLRAYEITRTDLYFSKIKRIKTAICLWFLYYEIHRTEKNNQ